MMTRRMQRMAQANRAQQPQGAPRQTMIAGQPHMLAYINEAERQMLKRAGGAEAPGPAGIPAYWELFKPSTWGDGKGYQGTGLGGGGVDTSFADDVLDNPSNFLPGASSDSDNNNVNDYDEFQAVYNTQLVDAQQNPYGMSTADGVYTGNSYGGNSGTGNSTTTSGSGNTASAPVNTGPTPEELAEQARQAALDAALGRLAKAFGFATDDYFTGLGTSYREGGLSESFQTAYDDAQRGIMDQFKAQGLLTQSDVDDEMGILTAALGGEEGRLDNIVSSYVDANRNYVSGGRSSIENTLRGLGSAEAINAFNIDSAVQPYKEPTEQAVVDFFTDFVKRAYDPSYNVDPTAVASGNPKRVSDSVDQQGANSSPSALSGIFDPVSGNSSKVIK